MGSLRGGCPGPNLWLIAFRALSSKLRHDYRHLTSHVLSYREESTRPEASARKAPYKPSSDALQTLFFTSISDTNPGYLPLASVVVALRVS